MMQEKFTEFNQNDLDSKIIDNMERFRLDDLALRTSCADMIQAALDMMSFEEKKEFAMDFDILSEEDFEEEEE